ncbi:MULTISPECIES: prephenate/arogenate dehydrogenase [unclassified Synechocystis]|uniref:prephenate/arogenate dehydrogenase n=1 Tax=unclassified Synechocystis TaxID=2640012 RepID=UPI000416C206|nr:MULTISPECIES: prephenate/arogenate dehydrogenase [unclassified Synechocystis]AIE73729.1 Arogenate dehydrogenase [Synechocystis sp. PCC 6714]MCT0252438.1 prephenate/arogenate dehydrogenase [Synechocystis sp. CS-94]
MKIGVVGLGLIGASLAGDLRRRGHYLMGVSRQQSTCEKAVERQLVDEAGQDLSLLQTAEIIFLCTPIQLILPTLERLIPHLAPTAIVTDVASVKMAIAAPASKLWPGFIGGHPMAGTAAQGIDGAEENLFINAPYVLTPTEYTDPDQLACLRSVLEPLGVKIYLCTPADHDQAVAWISHLPVMISAALIQACAGEKDANILNLAQNLASSGFRDTSRVGGGNPELGTMMATYNQRALLKSLQDYRQQLDNLISLINDQQWSELHRLLQQTNGDRTNYIQ